MKNKKRNKDTKICQLKAMCCDSHPNVSRNFDTIEAFNEHVDTGIKNYIQIIKSDRKIHLSRKKKERWTCHCPWEGCSNKSRFYGSNWILNLKKHVIAKHGGVRPYRCQWDKKCPFNGGTTRDHLVKHVRAQHLHNNADKKQEALHIVNKWYKRKKKKKNTEETKKIDEDQSSSIALDPYSEFYEPIQQSNHTEEHITMDNIDQLWCYEDYILMENHESFITNN
jgi:hypothetical protein